MTSDENTKTETAEIPPPAPNGHGSNGAPKGEPHTEAGSVRKRKKKRPQASATSAESVAQDPAPTVDDATESAETATTMTSNEPPATDASAADVHEGLRLRMKVWTDPKTAKRYLMPAAFMQDVVNGRPVSDVMRAYAMSEEDTKIITLRAHEWNALPFYYFQEDGPAPRASARPADVIPGGRAP